MHHRIITQAKNVRCMLRDHTRMQRFHSRRTFPNHDCTRTIAQEQCNGIAHVHTVYAILQALSSCQCITLRPVVRADLRPAAATCMASSAPVSNLIGGVFLQGEEDLRWPQRIALQKCTLLPAVCKTHFLCSISSVCQHIHHVHMHELGLLSQLARGSWQPPIHFCEMHLYYGSGLMMWTEAIHKHSPSSRCTYVTLMHSRDSVHRVMHIVWQALMKDVTPAWRQTGYMR